MNNQNLRNSLKRKEVAEIEMSKFYFKKEVLFVPPQNIIKLLKKYGKNKSHKYHKIQKLNYNGLILKCFNLSKSYTTEDSLIVYKSEKNGKTKFGQIHYFLRRSPDEKYMIALAKIKVIPDEKVICPFFDESVFYVKKLLT